jgi:ABC-type sugar transport system ATPase subunit
MALLAGSQITVRYGGTTALDAVDFDLAAGEIHALVGENGAGKSTLLRVLAGVRRADGGTLALAPRARVAWVPQEPELPPDCTAEQWIFLGAERRGRFGWLRAGEMAAGAAAALAAVGSAVPPAARCGALAASQRKQVQLARALRDGAAILLLDEPTAVLGAGEAARLFAAVRAARAAGAGIVYVSHRLDEVLALADRVTVLRDGRRVATTAAAAVDAARLVRLMVGRELAAETARRAAVPGETLLRVEKLCSGRVRGVTLRVRAGEVVGLAGLLGAGRSAVLESIAGLRPRRGEVACAAPPVLLGEDRVRSGLVPTFDLRQNIFLPAPRRWLDHAGEHEATRHWMRRLGIRATGPEAPIAALSGGNQQKALLARALRRARGLLLLDEPTAGVDVGAKADIHAQVRALAAGGAAILLASSDLPELLHLCDRILALYAGRVAGEFLPGDGEEAIAAAITGAPARRGGGAGVWV